MQSIVVACVCQLEPEATPFSLHNVRVWLAKLGALHENTLKEVLFTEVVQLP